MGSGYNLLADILSRCSATSPQRHRLCEKGDWNGIFHSDFDRNIEFSSFLSTLQYYSSGKRLPIPAGCPAEVYKLMLESWGEGAGPRKQPQAVMRDINQILYQVYNSRRIHAYETAFPKVSNDSGNVDIEEGELDSSDSESRASSLFTDRTSLAWDECDDGMSDEVPTRLLLM